MHILTIPTWYVTEARPDVGIYFRELALFFQRAGNQSGVVYADTNWEDIGIKLKSGSYRNVRCYNDEGMQTVRFDGFGWSRRFTFGQVHFAQKVMDLFERYVQDFGQPDVILAHGYPAAFAASAIQAKYQVPFAYLEHMTGLSRKNMPAAHKHMLQVALKNADYSAAVSSQLRQYVLQYFPEYSQLQVMPNVVDTQCFTLSNRPAPTQTFTFTNIGDLIDRRAPEVSLAAFAIAQKRLFNWSLKLEMIGHGNLLGKLKAQAEHLGLSNKVSFHGLMENAQVGAFLAIHTDALLLTSRLETFGVVLIEAMACGIPVVSTRSGGPSDIVTTETGLLAPVDHDEAIADAMCQVVLNYHKYEKLSIRNYAVQTFGHEAVTARWMAIFEKMIAQGE
jgi:glycosyltransferase involved in cell wall biosynthesis